MTDHVVIKDRITKTTWHRKIGDGPWEEMDLSLYGGRPPWFIPVLDSGKANWFTVETWEPT